MQYIKALTVMRTQQLTFGEAQQFFDFNTLLEERLRLAEFRDTGGAFITKYGFVEVTEDRIFEQLECGAILLRVRRDHRNIPTTAINEELMKRIDPDMVAAEQQRIRFEVIEELAKNTPPASTYFSMILWNSLLILPVTSTPLVEAAQDLFAKVFRHYAKPVLGDIKDFLTKQVRQWLDDQQATSETVPVGKLPFYLGESISLRTEASKEEKANTISIHSAILADLLCNNLSGQLRVHKVAAVQIGTTGFWFTLKSNGAISGIQITTEDQDVEEPDGMTPEQLEEHKREQMLHSLEAQLLIVIAHYGRLIAAMDIVLEPLEADDEEGERQLVIIDPDEIKALVARSDRIGPSLIQREFQCSFGQALSCIQMMKLDGWMEAAGSYYVQSDKLRAVVSATTPAEQALTEAVRERQESDEGKLCLPDPLLIEAIAFVRASGTPSISAIQRHFRIGYNRAAILMEAMEANGVVSCSDASGRRTVIKQEA